MESASFVNLKNPTAFTRAHKVHKATNKSKKDIKKALLELEAYRLHYPAPRKFQRRRTYVPFPNLTWGLDLAEITKYSKSNFNKHSILVYIDFFDRCAWFEPLKTKNSEEVLNALKNIIKRSGRQPKALYHDRGREFVSQTFKAFCEQNNIHV